jgi:hypothetical protein
VNQHGMVFKLLRCFVAFAAMTFESFPYSTVNKMQQ